MMNPVLTVVVKSQLKDFNKAVKELTARQILVGVPESGDKRRDAAGNALIAYVQDNGSPFQGIPKREFLRTGIEAGKAAIVAQMEGSGRAAFRGDMTGVDKGLNGAGLAAQAAVRAKINTGPFSPLQPATLAARRRRGRTGTRPLIDTGQLRNSINYVVVKS